MSVQNRKGRLDDEPMVERFAVEALRGVGSSEGEWWYWSPGLVGHLRVPVTEAEHELVPPGCVVDDAGVEGEWRERTA